MSPRFGPPEPRSQSSARRASRSTRTRLRSSRSGTICLERHLGDEDGFSESQPRHGSYDFRPRGAVTPWLSDLFLGSQTDERLVTLARAGQERAFVAIVQRYQRPLLAFARRLDSAGRAEDIVQQSFLSAFAALQAGAEVEHLRGW